MRSRQAILALSLTAIAGLLALMVWGSDHKEARRTSHPLPSKLRANLPAAVAIGYPCTNQPGANVHGAVPPPTMRRLSHGNLGDERCARTPPATAPEVARGQARDEDDRFELQQTLDWLQEDLRDTENPLVREQTIRELADIGVNEAYALISQSLADPDGRVRTAAIEKLGAAGSDQLHFLGQVILTEPNPELRRQALEAIAKQKSPAALALLRLALQDSDEEIVLLAETSLATLD
ncbi:MAG: HEAT repeat domain-containing protein, partial [Thiohalocapsa sp.]